jgi:phosphate transport system permease protein
MSSGGVLLLILGFVAAGAGPALLAANPLRFLSDIAWEPTSGAYGMTPMIAGTLFVSAGAIVIAAPLSVLSATFCQFYAPNPVSVVYRRTIELLAGIPSVVFGLWGLTRLVPVIASLSPPGPSLLAGILILSLMILPTVALLVDSAIASIPTDDIRSARAVGLSTWATIQAVVLPVSRPAIFTGMLLAFTRAIGETMAVLMVCGNIVQIPDSFFAPIRTLTANIALEMAYATGAHQSVLFVSGLSLLLIVGACVAAAGRLSKGRIYG